MIWIISALILASGLLVLALTAVAHIARLIEERDEAIAASHHEDDE